MTREDGCHIGNDTCGCTHSPTAHERVQRPVPRHLGLCVQHRHIWGPLPAQDTWHRGSRAQGRAVPCWPRPGRLSQLQSPKTRSSLPRAGFPPCHIRPFSGRLSWALHGPAQHRAHTSTMPRSLAPRVCLPRRHIHAFLCSVCGVDLLWSLLCLSEVLCQLREGASLHGSCTEAGTTVAWEENGRRP